MTNPMKNGFGVVAAFLGRNMNHIHVLALLGLAIRIYVALQSEQIHHPDELFQYLEQAHRLVFGYGHITWEFRWGARSWILPGFISSILFLCKTLNLDDPTIYIPVVKSFFSVLSVSLIYSAYYATRRITTPMAATLASLFVCFWYELIYFASRPTPEVLAAYLIVAALALVLDRTETRKPFLFGLLAAMAIALRLQYAVPAIILVSYAAWAWRSSDLRRSALAFLLVVVVAGYIDRLTWGKMFASYVNSYLYNVQYNVSAVFGVGDSSYYLLALVVTSSGLLLVAGLMAIRMWRKTGIVLALVAGVIASHSLIPHKEYRFIFVVIPLMLMLLAIILSSDFWNTQSTRTAQRWRMVAILGFLGISVAGAVRALPFERFVYADSIMARSEVLDAALALSQEKDVYAVVSIASAWYKGGGYYYLHKNIPVYYRNIPGQNRIDINEAASYASHIICPVDFPEVRGFETSRRWKAVEIRTRVDKTAPYRKLDIDTINIMQDGIDNRRWQ